MSENWDFYLSYDGDHPMSVMVDLARRATSPDPGLPTVVNLRVVMRQPRDDGLSSREEFDQLNAIDDAVTAPSESPRLVYVGRATGRGNRDFLFYTDDGPAAELLLLERAAAFPGYEFDCRPRPDPGWEVYRDILYPSPREMQTIQSRRVLEVLARQGDVPAVERDVAHWAYFPTADSRDQFVGEAADRGYRETDRTDDDKSPNRFKVVVAKAQPADYGSVTAATLELYDLAGECGGRYDGWETSVEKGG